MNENDSPKLPRPVHTQPAGVAHTVEEAEQALVETIARCRVLEDLGRAHREADTTAKLDLADALVTALGITLPALYARLGARIEATYSQFLADVGIVR
jgi:hypothetical protein